MKFIFRIIFFIIISLNLCVADTETEITCWLFLLTQGFTKEGVAAIMGNLYAMSGIQNHIYQDSYHSSIGLSNEDYVKKTNQGTYTNFINDGAGFGIAQWSPVSRKGPLLNKCKGKIGDLDCQLNFLVYELYDSFNDVYKTLKNSHDLKLCSIEVTTKYECPTNYKTSSVQNSIYQNSLNYYNKFSNINCHSDKYYYSLKNNECYILNDDIYDYNENDCLNLIFFENKLRCIGLNIDSYFLTKYKYENNKKFFLNSIFFKSNEKFSNQEIFILDTNSYNMSKTNSCFNTINNCKVYLKINYPGNIIKNECLKCDEQSYAYKGKECRKRISTINNCDYYPSKNGECQTCQKGYIYSVESNYCFKMYYKIENCLVHLESENGDFKCAAKAIFDEIIKNNYICDNNWGYFYDKDNNEYECLPQNELNIGYYKDNNNIYYKCIEYCDNCINSKSCNKCQKGYELVGNRENNYLICLSENQLNNGYYRNNSIFYKNTDNFKEQNNLNNDENTDENTDENIDENTDENTQNINYLNFILFILLIIFYF